MMQWILFVTMMIGYHVHGFETVSEMLVSENKNDLYHPLNEKINDLDTKVTSMATKLSRMETEMERKFSEFSSWIYGSRNDVAETNSASIFLFGRSRVEGPNGCFVTVANDSSGYLGTNQVIIFDKIVTNRCRAYNKVHGYFFAPVSGTYIFYVTVGDKSGSGTYHICVNGNVRGRLQVGSSNYQASQTLIIYLSKGNHVSVKNGHFKYDKLKGDYHTTFAGFLMD